MTTIQWWFWFIYTMLSKQGGVVNSIYWKWIIAINIPFVSIEQYFFDFMCCNNFHLIAVSKLKFVMNEMEIGIGWIFFIDTIHLSIDYLLSQVPFEFFPFFIGSTNCACFCTHEPSGNILGQWIRIMVYLFQFNAQFNKITRFFR